MCIDLVAGAPRPTYGRTSSLHLSILSATVLVLDVADEDVAASRGSAEAADTSAGERDGATAGSAALAALAALADEATDDEDGEAGSEAWLSVSRPWSGVDEAARTTADDEAADDDDGGEGAVDEAADDACVGVARLCSAVDATAPMDAYDDSDDGRRGGGGGGG
jgi:hypothetical protein